MKYKAAIIVLCCLLGAITAIQVTDQTFRVKRGEFGMQLLVAEITVSLDGPVYVQGTEVSKLSTGKSCMRWRGEKCENWWPDSAIKQSKMGGAKLVCTNVQGKDFVVNMTIPSSSSAPQNGPPNYLLPGIPSSDVGSMFIALMSGLDPPPAATVNDNQLGFMAILEYRDEKSGWTTPIPLKPTDINKCHIAFNKSGGYTDSTGAFLGDTVVKTAKLVKAENTCSMEGFKNITGGLIKSIQSMKEASSQQELRVQEDTLTVYTLMEQWQGCLARFKVLLQTDDVLRNRTVEGCRSDWGTVAWGTDPCCNETMLYEQCCSKKTEEIKEQSVTGLNPTTMAKYCAQGDIEKLGKLFVKVEEVMPTCEEKFKQEYGGSDTWKLIDQYTKSCHDELWGSKECNSDSDCLTNCDSTSKKCVQPWSDPFPYLAKCYVKNAPDDLLNYMLRKWNLPPSAKDNPSEITAEFQKQFATTECLGPESEKARRHFDQALNKWVPANKTLCLEKKQCNWNTQLDSTSCTSGLSTNFCGQCEGSWCWEVSKFPACVANNGWSESECTAMGATWKSNTNGYTGPQCIFTSLTTENDCIGNTNLCPANYKSWWGNKEWKACPQVCSDNTKTNKTACEAESGKWWNPNFANGNPICQSYYWDQSQCTGAGYTWNPGKLWYDGEYNNQEKCEVGLCQHNWGLNKTQCAEDYYCTEQCRKCTSDRWQTQCLDLSGNETHCTGSWDKFSNSCSIWEHQQDQTACTNAGYSFQNCEDLTWAQCQSCKDGGACDLNQALLQCRPNEWAMCRNKAECNAGGQCDDYEMGNWDKMDAQGMCGEACSYSCILPFEVTQNGDTKCPDNNNNIRWSKIGCKDTSITSSAACYSAGGRWEKKAFNKAECDAHGGGCKEKRYWNLTPKEQVPCENCGGKYETYFNWRPGVWAPGKMTNLTWNTREYGSINSWGTTFDDQKMWDFLSDALASKISIMVKSRALCTFSLLSEVGNAMLAQCAGQGSTGLISAPVAEEIVWAGQDNVLDTMCGEIIFKNGSIPESTGSVEIEISCTPTEVLGESTAASRRRLLAADPYELVYSSKGAIVGKLVSAGLGVTVSGTASFEICPTHNAAAWTADILTKYPVSDFATTTDNEKWTPSMLSGVTLDQANDKTCGSVSASGTYYAIQRVADPESVPTPTVVPPTPTAVPTATAKPDPTPTAAAKTETTSSASVFAPTMLVLVLALLSIVF